MAHLITILIGMKPPDGTSALVRVQVIRGSALDGFFKIKWASRSLFFVYFRSFQTNNTFLQQINVKICPSSIWCWDSNPQPLKHESSPITTRTGLCKVSNDMLGIKQVIKYLMDLVLLS